MKTWLKGGLIGGLAILLILVMELGVPYCIQAESNFWNQKAEYHKFSLCQLCNVPRSLDCAVEKCNEALSWRPDGLQTDREYVIKKCDYNYIVEYTTKHRLNITKWTQSFIETVCGYRYDTYKKYYGLKPNRISAYFDANNFKGLFSVYSTRTAHSPYFERFLWTFFSAIILIILLAIVAGSLIGQRFEMIKGGNDKKNKNE